MLKKILISGAFACFAAAAQAQVTVNANGVENLVLSSSGTTLAAGDLVRLGYFSSTANLGTSNSFSILNSIFTAIGEGNANGGTLSENGNSGTTMDIDNYNGTQGAFLGSFSGVSATYFGASDTGLQLYMWVFNSSDASSATQWGIFDAPSWTFPANLGTVTMSLGSSDISVIRGSTSGSDFELANIPASVPEPSSLASFGLVIVLGSALLRRRK